VTRDRIPYQLTPEASKGNAFCWLSWRPRIDWCPPPAQGRPADYTSRAQAQTERVEAMRARGIDPLHIPGMNSQRIASPAALEFTTYRRKAA